MLDLGVIATSFALIFVAELPDKTAIASLVLGTKYSARWVLTGVISAFFIHTLIAVAAGKLISLLPHRPVEGVVGLLFLFGAIYLWRRGAGDEDEEEEMGEIVHPTNLKVAATAFTVIFIAEFGDLTQIMTANLAARFPHDFVSVTIGATLGLVAVALVAVVGGKALLRVIPVEIITRVAAVIMGCLAVYSIYSAIAG